MRRRAFDIIMTSVGGLLVVLLAVAGGLLTWGYTFADTTVHDQLAAQQIYFPPKGSPALASPEIGPYLNKYAGQQLVNGAQAEAYADHFIAVHLKEVAGGKTYAQVSSEQLANPNSVVLKNQADTLFRGETLRGMLLNAYAFWQLGQIAKSAAICCFVAAAGMLVLTLLGLWHLRRVGPTDEVFTQEHTP
jgi:hypothetical protein